MFVGSPGVYNGILDFTITLSYFNITSVFTSLMCLTRDINRADGTVYAQLCL